MNRIASPVLVIATVLIATLPLCAFQASSKPKYLDPEASPETRAADLVSRMTLEEKVSQMQNSAPAIPRLGIPAYDWWNEALHGVARAGLATVFPQAIGLAATWDMDLEHRITEAISTEARAKYNDAIKHDNHGRYYGLTFWSPNINLFRDPRWGRGQETYGEDPYLTSRMAIAFIKGMQGDDPRYFKTIATSKHYAVHSGPETSRHQFDAKVTEQDLESYLYAFRATVLEAGVDSFMCAYNRVNGAPACASDFLLAEKLRNAWHFGGYVVSDCDAIDDIYTGHHYASSLAEASAKAVKAGTDLDCGKSYRTLTEAVSKGYIDEREIDRSLERLFVARFRLGMFDPGERVPFSKIEMDQVESPSHQRLALEAAEKSIVLLKNDGVLPFQSIPKHIAVIGPAADDPDVLLGNYNGIPSHIITPAQGIARKFGKTSEVVSALGSTYVESWPALIPEAALTPDGTAGRHGLKAEYFANDNLSGQPQLTRVDPRGYFVWDMSDPAVVKAVPRQSFSLRWTGSIEVKRTGDYQLGVMRVECHSCGRRDSASIYLDGKLLVDDKKRAADQMSATTATATLQAGHSHLLRVEYRGTGGGGGLELVWKPPADVALQDALDLAKRSDVAVLCIGLNSRLEGEESKIAIPGFSGGDRTSLDLPAPQQKLLRSVLDTGKPVVVVLMNGSALAVPIVKTRARAVLESWYGGQEGGTALANTLSGDNNPAGRLPITFYESLNDLPPFDDYSMQGRTYRFFKGPVLFPFGFGLSYSKFEYSALAAKRASGGYEVTASVRNDSSRDGDEVAQLYLRSQPESGPQLKGFERIHLRAGEIRSLRFFVASEDAKAAHFVSIGGGQPLRNTGVNPFSQIPLP